jgi:hypothetical protein
VHVGGITEGPPFLTRAGKLIPATGGQTSI